VIPEEFEDKFTTLVAMAMADAYGDADFGGAMIAVMARSLGRTIAILGRGDQVGTGELLDGAMHYAEVEAANFLPFGKAVAKSRRE
jgi:hypothetical protein